MHGGARAAVDDEAHRRRVKWWPHTESRATSAWARAARAARLAAPLRTRRPRAGKWPTTQIESSSCVRRPRRDVPSSSTRCRARRATASSPRANELRGAVGERELVGVEHDEPQRRAEPPRVVPPPRPRRGCAPERAGYRAELRRPAAPHRATARASSTATCRGCRSRAAPASPARTFAVPPPRRHRRRQRRRAAHPALGAWPSQSPPANTKSGDGAAAPPSAPARAPTDRPTGHRRVAERAGLVARARTLRTGRARRVRQAQTR